MKWLADNYKWLFDGIGALVVIGVVGYLLRGFRRAAEVEYRLVQPERQEKTDSAELSVEDSQVTNSPVATGTGIFKNVIHVGATAPPALAPVPIAQPERHSPNIQMTSTGVAPVFERGRGVWKEDVQGTEQAVVIQFTNEARPGGRNVGGLVKAALVYKNDQAEVLRIIGSWLDASGDHTEFRVDESHKLMVGIKYAQMFIVIGRRHVYEQSRFTIETEPHDLPVFQTVRVNLTNANTGDFLYEGEFRVTVNPLGIVFVG